MKTYRVTEKVVYEYEAESEVHACELCVDDEERDQKFVEVLDRYAECVE